MAVPAATPSAMAVVSPPNAMVATDVALLLQVPPSVVSEKRAGCPAQREAGPSMGDTGLTMSVAISMHPEPRV